MLFNASGIFYTCFLLNIVIEAIINPIITTQVITIGRVKSDNAISFVRSFKLFDESAIGLYSCSFGTMFIKNKITTNPPVNNKQP